jgi:hypothetical protein
VNTGSNWKARGLIFVFLSQVETDSNFRCLVKQLHLGDSGSLPGGSKRNNSVYSKVMERKNIGVPIVHLRSRFCDSKPSDQW